MKTANLVGFVGRRLSRTVKTNKNNNENLKTKNFVKINLNEKKTLITSILYEL